MCSSCKYPCLCTCVKVRLWCPEVCCYRKLWHRLLCLLAVNCIDNETETVTQINKWCGNTGALLWCKYKSCRILSVAHCKRLALDADRTVCNWRTNLKHMSLEYSLFALHEIVGVVLEHWCTLGILLSCCHDLHETYHCCNLPVALCSKAVALFHETLDCKSRKLL